MRFSILTLALACASLASARSTAEDLDLDLGLDLDLDSIGEANAANGTIINIAGLPKCVKKCIYAHPLGTQLLNANVSTICWTNRVMLQASPVEFSIPIVEIDDDRLWGCHVKNCGTKSQREGIALATRNFFRRTVCRWPY